MSMAEFIQNHKVVISYLFFGICTIFFNIGIYCVCIYFLKFHTMQGTIIAWTGAVLFAYKTNKWFVFCDEKKEKRAELIQMIFFFAMRLGTGIFDWAFMLVFVDLFCFNDIVCKVIANIIVVVLNFVASKFVIFK